METPAVEQAPVAAGPTIPHSKTPISFLMELCTKKGFTPSYDLVSSGGPVHEPLFLFKVTAGEHTGTGQGSTKKVAKHSAAQQCLSKVLGLPDGASMADAVAKYTPPAKAPAATPTTPTTTTPTTPGDPQANNPIGRLQEMSQIRSIPPPNYEFTDSGGLPHIREYFCTVKFHTSSEEGIGKSKKAAKRKAAETLLDKIQLGTADLPPVPESEPKIKKFKKTFFKGKGFKKAGTNGQAAEGNDATMETSPSPDPMELYPGSTDQDVNQDVNQDVTNSYGYVKADTVYQAP